jgi:tricorn protease
VVPVKTEQALRNRDWVEGNLAKVNAATGGRVAYIYVPNTSQLGHSYFKRYFFPQSYKEAVIVDERFNAGGSLADYYIDILRRPLIAYWAMRYGDDMKTPASIQGPRAMIIDETAGSGGDLLPWMFHKFGMGPLIGQATWGGLVGTLGFPILMDGGAVTAPNLAIWTPDKGWVVENEGVPPDIEVEQTPADVIAGRDPQLEKAIEVVMAALAKSPSPKPKRPPYPVKVRAPSSKVSAMGSAQ